jgi:hypothetical protein
MRRGAGLLRNATRLTSDEFVISRSDWESLINVMIADEAAGDSIFPE